jgi:hypothetical protein
MVQTPPPSSAELGGQVNAFRVVSLVLAGSVAFALLAAGLSGLGYEALTRHGRVPIAKHQAEATAVHTIAQSQRRTAPAWNVRHSKFHPYSATVSDSSGQPRITSSWNSCASGDVGRTLDQEGILCPPPPVWAIEVQTLSRPADHRALVEIDALSGDVLAWFIDDSLP